MVDFGLQLRIAQERRDMSIETLAGKLGVTRAAVSNLRRKKDVRLSTAVRVAQTLDMTLTELLEG